MTPDNGMSCVGCQHMAEIEIPARRKAIFVLLRYVCRHPAMTEAARNAGITSNGRDIGPVPETPEWCPLREE